MKERNSDINRRDFVKHCLGCAAGGTALINFNGMVAFADAKKEKGIKSIPPNIILIVTDDQMMSSFDVLPVLRSQLADQGVTFSNSFCASPVCAPSRASILTGQYMHNHAEHTNSTHRFVKKRDHRNTIGTILKAGGYKTVFLGKYSHGYDDANYIPPGWDEWHALLGGAPGYYNYQMSENGKLASYGNQTRDYSTDVLARKAYHFIEKYKKSKEPFFMYIAPSAPHAPQTPALRHINKFDHLNNPPPLFEKDISDKPQWVHNYRRLNVNNPEWLMQERASKKKLKGLEALLAVDEMLGEIIKMLIENENSPNTYIFYLADNGDDLSRHIPSTGKLLPYEEGIRTPIIVRGPGIEAGARREHLVSNTDLLPTIAELARLPIPDFVDGRSLTSLFSCPSLPKSEWRKACLVELGKVNEWYRLSPPPAYKLLRARDFKYIEYETGEKEFYDLRLDPNELINIYKDLHQELKRKLHVHLQQMQKTSGNQYRQVENHDISIYR